MAVMRLWLHPLTTPNSLPANAALLLGRIFIVLALFPNGLRKIATFDQTAAGMGGVQQMIDGRLFPDQTPLFHFPFPEFFLGASILLDLLGAALIVLGFRVRFVSAIVAAYVLAAMVIYHSDIRGAQDIFHLLRNLPFLGGLLVLAAAGGGFWSLDRYFQPRAADSATSAPPPP